MAINPLIALGVRTPNTTPQVQNFTQGVRRDRQQRVANDLAQRQEGRAQQTQDFAMEQAQASIKAKGKEASAKDYAGDVVGMGLRWKAGDMGAVRLKLTNRISKIDQSGLPSDDSRELLRRFDEDPGAFGAILDMEEEKAVRMGVLTAPKTDGGFSLSPGQSRFNADGSPVASVAPKPDTVSADREAQMIRISNAKSANSPITRLTVALQSERLEQARLANKKARTAATAADREAGKIEAASLTKARERTAFVGDTLKIVDRLLSTEGMEAVKSAAGPVGSMTPTFVDSTADAEIDLGVVRSRLTKENLKLLTGVISDNDIRFLEKISAGGLDLSGSDEGVIRDLKRIQLNLQAAQRQEVEARSGGDDLNEDERAELAALRASQ
jgi:hypothetical protein